MYLYSTTMFQHNIWDELSLIIFWPGMMYGKYYDVEPLKAHKLDAGVREEPGTNCCMQVDWSNDQPYTECDWTF